MSVQRLPCVLLLLALLGGQASGQEDCTSTIDLALIVDSSGSIRDNNPTDGSFDNWSLTLTFLSNLVAGLNVGSQGTRVGMVIFANRGRVEFNFLRYQTLSQVQAAILNTPYTSGNTNTSGGLLVAKDQLYEAVFGERPGFANVAVVMTDGKSTHDNEKTLASAAALKGEDVRIFVVGITDSVDEEQIQGIASPSNGTQAVLDTDFFLITDFTMLDVIVDQLKDTICNAVGPTPAPESNCLADPIVIQITPELGIMAGGARLTLSGKQFPPCHVLITYADYQAGSLEPCSDTTCYAMTPPGWSQDIGISFPVSVTFLGQRPITTQSTFTYRSSPKVSSIHPLETLAAGGTTLTVDGEGFDAVNEPELIVRMVHTKESPGNGTVNETTTTSQCAITANDTLKCPTPALDIPEEFQKAIGTQSADAGGGDGENDAAGDYVWNIEGESLEFHLGVGLDGEQKYRDLTKSLPEYSQIKVFLQEPEFDRFTETREVSGGESLEITGKRLTDGLEKTDYVVRIGVGSCRVVDITANQLLCEVPEEEGLAEEDEHSVLVYPGTNISPHNIGMIQYRSSQTTLWIIIGACVGIVIIAIICCMIVCLKRRASNNRNQQEQQQQQAVQMQEQKQRQDAHHVQPHQGKPQKKLQSPDELGYLNDNMAPGLHQADPSNHANDQSDEGYLNDHFAP